MSVYEAILTALFCMVVVFSVLILIWVITRLFSFTLRHIEKNMH